MGNEACEPVSVSRRIQAPIGDIFEVLADPGRHPEFDGSGMLRPGAGREPVSGVGDVFVMKMHFTAMGDYEMHNRVVAYETDRCIAWEPGRQDADRAEGDLTPNGSRWRFDLTADGPAATVVTETYDCSGCSAEVRHSLDNGRRWITGMTETLERLDQLCTEG